MPIVLPNLDDRSYADMVEEARSLIPTYAPEWTNHNASDPGITLVEMLAYLTEMLIYRLNRVTDANVCAFLKLIDSVERRPLGEGFVEEVRTKEGQEEVRKLSLNESIREVTIALRTPDRAVTAEDFEQLVLDGFAERVRRVRCVGDRNIEVEDAGSGGVFKPGHVSLMIVPGEDNGDSKPMPGEDLIRDVTNFLEPRRLLTTRVHVVAPRYVAVGVRITLHLKPDWEARAVGDAAVAELRRFLNPVAGGKDHKGWPFGRNVYVSEIYELLDWLPGVDYVTPSVDPGTDLPLGELIADASRLKRKSTGELISVELFPDELAAAVIDDYQSGGNERTVSITSSLDFSS